MVNLTISDLPPQANLSLFQKRKAVAKANELIKCGKTVKQAIAGGIGSVLVQKGVDLTPDEEQRISYDVIYEPDTPDAHNQWMSKETLVKAQADFKKAQETGAVTENLFHQYDTNLFKILDHWISPEFDVVVPETGQLIKAGTWVAKVQYSPELWELKKAGIVGGLSIQCGGVIDDATGEISELSFGIELEEDEE